VLAWRHEERCGKLIGCRLVGVLGVPVHLVRPANARVPQEAVAELMGEGGSLAAGQGSPSVEAQGILDGRELPDPDFNAPWDAIVVAPTLEDELLAQGVLNFTLRSRVNIDGALVSRADLVRTIGLPTSEVCRTILWCVRNPHAAGGQSGGIVAASCRRGKSCRHAPRCEPIDRRGRSFGRRRSGSAKRQEQHGVAASWFFGSPTFQRIAWMLPSASRRRRRQPGWGGTSDRWRLARLRLSDLVDGLGSQLERLEPSAGEARLRACLLLSPR
jgi:hypothetical protein